MDEIHVKSELTYKGGKVFGSSLNTIEPAKNFFACMVSSLSKKWSTIVRLLPCSNSSASELFPIIKMVIEDIERCGLYVKYCVQITTQLMSVSSNCFHRIIH